MISSDYYFYVSSWNNYLQRHASNFVRKCEQQHNMYPLPIFYLNILFRSFPFIIDFKTIIAGPFRLGWFSFAKMSTRIILSKQTFINLLESRHFFHFKFKFCKWIPSRVKDGIMGLHLLQLITNTIGQQNVLFVWPLA